MKLLVQCFLFSIAAAVFAPTQLEAQPSAPPGYGGLPVLPKQIMYPYGKPKQANQYHGPWYASKFVVGLVPPYSQWANNGTGPMDYSVTPAGIRISVPAAVSLQGVYPYGGVIGSATYYKHIFIPTPGGSLQSQPKLKGAGIQGPLLGVPFGPPSAYPKIPNQQPPNPHAPIQQVPKLEMPVQQIPEMQAPIGNVPSLMEPVGDGPGELAMAKPNQGDQLPGILKPGGDFDSPTNQPANLETPLIHPEGTSPRPRRARTHSSNLAMAIGLRDEAPLSLYEANVSSDGTLLSLSHARRAMLVLLFVLGMAVLSAGSCLIVASLRSAGRPPMRRFDG